MITDTYDIATQPVITPERIYGAQGKECEVCIITYSVQILEDVLRTFDCRKITEMHACNGSIPIYGFISGGKRIAIYLTMMGSAMAANCVIEANWLTGARKFVMFGSAGAINRPATQGKVVVPVAAYRDEGMSYHYAPPSDYIDVPYAKKTGEILESLHVPYVFGKTWTTDAIYRETRGHVQSRKDEGCLTVEMEVAGVQAVCTHSGLELYNFLITGDVLDMPEWDVAELSKANHNLDNFALALEIARRV